MLNEPKVLVPPSDDDYDEHGVLIRTDGAQPGPTVLSHVDLLNLVSGMENRGTGSTTFTELS
jgi:hypothetical protein